MDNDEIHKISDVFAALVAVERIAGRVRQILGSQVYVHQSRINLKPPFRGSGFYWHSDFETWHSEDGLPPDASPVGVDRPDRQPDTNGGPVITPGSHRTFVGCVGATPAPPRRPLSDLVRLQPHARLRRQHHPLPPQQPVRRLQQRRLHPRRALRRSRPPPRLRRRTRLHAALTPDHRRPPPPQKIFADSCHILVSRPVSALKAPNRPT
ncbi:phytanoyl-CoA dioxygenase family protein [Streptomyces sp. ISL-87]|nr:phytanoyl-CoA dioxygenase family protein [Streptomyces sp. ISL-21]MBT2608745.1 phytanoyl-CoA dioxygenase family protein [Streptomyces sp. ISL-87]